MAFMIEVEVGEFERREIDAQIARILRDLGNPPPPLNLTDVRNLLKIDLTYYKSTDPSFLQESRTVSRCLRRRQFLISENI